MGNRFCRVSGPRRNLGRRRRCDGQGFGKNKPLKRVSVRWCSQSPLTENQLRRKRDEFWDTAPVFEGRIEIWNALKMAVEFVQKEDYEMAQAILDGADITLPTGSLCDCYDRLGTRYQLPLYVFSEPCNIIRGHSLAQSSAPRSTNETERVTANQKRGPFPVTRACSTGCRRLRNSDRWLVFSWSRAGRRPDNKNHICESEPPSDQPTGPFYLHLRSSTGQDFTLELPNDHATVLQAKQLLAAQTSWPPSSQRWFVCGRLLPNHTPICDCQIPEGFLIQVFVHTAMKPLFQSVVEPAESADSNVHPLDLTPALLIDSF